MMPIRTGRVMPLMKLICPLTVSHPVQFFKSFWNPSKRLVLATMVMTASPMIRIDIKPKKIPNKHLLWELAPHNPMMVDTNKMEE